MPIYKETGKDEYSINIIGEIGTFVSGGLIVETIDHLNEIGAKKIIEKINSNGGYVDEGLAIINANLTSNATIETINIGVAGSIAAVILASGDVRKAYDNSFALIHDPQLSGETLEKIKDKNTKNNLLKMKAALVKTLVDACNQPEKVINKLMTRETAFTPQEQKEFGLVDKIIKSRTKAPKSRNLSLTEIMNHYTNQIASNDLKSLNMDELTNFLSLNSDASEKSILKAVKALSIKADNSENVAITAMNDLENKEAELVTVLGELKTAKEKLKSFNDVVIKNSVDAAINSGKFIEDQREKLTEQATKDLEMFNSMVSSMAVVQKSALGVIQNNLDTQNSPTEGEVVKDWDYYQKNDPNYLKTLEISNVTEYAKLYLAYWGEKYEPAKTN